MSKDSVTYFKAYIPPETAFAFRIQRNRKVDKQHEANMPCLALLCPRYGQREEVTQILGFALGTRRFLDTNLLVLVTQNARFGVMPNAMPNREGVRSCDSCHVPLTMMLPIIVTMRNSGNRYKSSQPHLTGSLELLLFKCAHCYVFKI